MTCNSLGDTQTFKGMSGAVSVVSSGAHKILFEPSEHLWQVWGLILMQFCPSYHLSGVFPFPLDTRFFFFFLVGCNILLLMVVQQQVLILEFLQEKMSARPSTPPYPLPNP